MAKFPLGICQKAVATEHKAIRCDLCNKWIHIGCNNLNKTNYIQIQHSDTNWFCMPCLKNEVPFNTLTDHELEKVYNGKHILPFTSKNTKSLTKNTHDFLQDKTNNKIHCLYCDVANFNKMVVIHVNSFSVLHLNIFSLHIKFNVIGITESRLKLNVQPLVNTNLQNSNIDEIPTESEKGRALLYICSDINYKVCKYLNIYEAKELESIFIEIINKNRKNFIMGCICKHPKMSIQYFNNILIPTLEKISKENKDTYLMGDFNINLINYDCHNPTSQFLDGIYANSFFPYINVPICHTPRSKALIDYIFHNKTNENAIPGNLTTHISDHLAQFLITPTLAKFKMKPKKILTRNFRSFSHENFKNDLRQADWTNTLKLQLSNVNYLV